MPNARVVGSTWCTRIPSRATGTRGALPPVPRRARWKRPEAVDRRHLQRFRSLLDAQWTPGVCQRTARRVPALRPRLSDVHRVRHGGRRPRHPLPELPRDERVEPQRHPRRDDRLHALGLRGPQRHGGPPSLDHVARRPGPAPSRATTRRAPRGPTWKLRVRAIQLAPLAGHGRASRPGVWLAGDPRPAAWPTTTRCRP